MVTARSLRLRPRPFSPGKPLFSFFLGLGVQLPLGAGPEAGVGKERGQSPDSACSSSVPFPRAIRYSRVFPRATVHSLQ